MLHDLLCQSQSENGGLLGRASRVLALTPQGVDAALDRVGRMFGVRGKSAFVLIGQMCASCGAFFAGALNIAIDELGTQCAERVSQGPLETTPSGVGPRGTHATLARFVWLSELATAATDTIRARGFGGAPPGRPPVGRAQRRRDLRGGASEKTRHASRPT